MLGIPADFGRLEALFEIAASVGIVIFPQSVTSRCAVTLQRKIRVNRGEGKPDVLEQRMERGNTRQAASIAGETNEVRRRRLF